MHGLEPLCFVMHFSSLKVHHFVLGFVSLFFSFPSSSPYLLKTDSALEPFPWQLNGFLGVERAVSHLLTA